MTFVLRQYQRNCVDASIKFLIQNADNHKARLLWAGPTGCGKSVVELEILQKVPGAWLVTPRIEIIFGMLEKLGYDYLSRCSENDLLALAFRHRIGTPIKLANRWMAGELEAPTALLLDESHHDNSESWQNLHAMCLAPAVGFTATPYRGTPKETAVLHQRWGKPQWMISYEQAARDGFICMPFCSTEPLIDDDVINVVNGEFAVKSVESVSLSRIEDAARFIERFFDPITQKYDMPTMVTVPSTAVAKELETLVPNAVSVTADTPRKSRLTAFQDAEDGNKVLIHINVVSEGIDLRIRRLIDFSPTMSPVRWVQQVGRITRPWHDVPQYICLNRNLLRHAYVLAGALPKAARVVLQAEEAFKGYGKRPSGGRVFGTEGLGKLTGTDIKLVNGLTAVFYNFSRTINLTVESYAVIFHPLQAYPLWARRTDTISNGERTFGRWEPCEPMSDRLIGFSSAPSRPPTPKQLAWWQRSATGFGIAEQMPNTKQFQILPVLKDLCLRII